jgi:hypothetical protein
MKEKGAIKSNIYFGDKEEQAVFDYINTDSTELKNKLYNEILIVPFRKMVQSIAKRYPLHRGKYDLSEIEGNALNHLIEQMIKYRPFIIEKNIDGSDKWVKLSHDYRFWYPEDANEKLNVLVIEDSEINYRIFNSKAFSYLQTIVRNYLKDHSRKTYDDKKINLFYDDYVDQLENDENHSYSMDEDFFQLEKLMANIIDSIRDKITTDVCLTKNEIIVGEAIIGILNCWDVLFIEESPMGKYNKRVSNNFTKNKILFYIKEQTGLTTKEIRPAIKVFKDLYFLEKNEFFSNDEYDTNDSQLPTD